MSNTLLELYKKDGITKIGNLDDAFSASVTEERNGIFELEVNYPNEFPYADQIINENFIFCKPNDNQDVQKFRIYTVKQLMKNTLTIRARHESYDIATDYIEKLDLKGASCEYALNELFRNSFYSTDFRGFSDIVNIQDYHIENTNLLNAIAGKQGSIIDTFGTGAEIYRNNKEIHVLNKRGHDNDVTIEFGKNLTDFVLEVDLTGLETRVGGFAKYRDTNGNDVIVKSDWIDSKFIDNFSHPYVNTAGRRDYSSFFDEVNRPTKEALNSLCRDEFKINKRDFPKNKYTLKFIPLSKCVGYEATQDAISLCDTVRVIDSRFKLDTKVKVIKYTYDVLRQRYESMELGDPRTTLGNIIEGSSKHPSLTEQDVKDIIGNTPQTLPNTLPNTPVVTTKLRGLSSIEISWTFDNKPYYQYEVYASKEKGFTPNIFDLIHKGQSSSFVFEAKPAETWYFRVCGTNSHNERTSFSEEVEVNTLKAENLDAYFSEIGIGNAVAGEISAGYVEANSIKGNWIDARHLTVTDGNGKRTLDIDSFGRIRANFTSIQLNSQDVASVPYVTRSLDNLDIGARNYLRNANFLNTIEPHEIMNGSAPGVIGIGWFEGRSVLQMTDIGNWNETQYIKLKEVPVNSKRGFIISLDIYSKTQCKLVIDPTGVIDAENRELNITAINQWVRYTIQLPPGVGNGTSGNTNIQIYAKQGTKFTGYITDIMIEHGNKPSDFNLAYEDMEAKADALATKVNGFEQQITPQALKQTFSTEFLTKEGAKADYATKAELNHTSKELTIRVSQTGKPQLIPNGDLKGGAKFWNKWQSQNVIEQFGGYNWYTITPQYEAGIQTMGIMIPEIEIQAGKTYTVGAWVSGDVRILNYNYLMQLRDGTMVGTQRLEAVEIGDVSRYARRISLTFTAALTGFVQIMFGHEGAMQKDLKIRVAEACCYEGDIVYPFRPSEQANYIGDAFFDITGMGMRHENGSISRITPKEFELTDSLGRKKASMLGGNFYNYDVNNGHLLGTLTSNPILGGSYRGVTLASAGSANYLCLGNLDQLTDDDNFKIKPFVLLAKSDLPNTIYGSVSGGLNLMNTQCIFHESALFKKSPRFIGGFTILKNDNSPLNVYHSRDSLYVESSLALPTGGNFYGGGLYGGDITSIGYMLNGSYTDVIKLYSSIQQIDFLRPLNMNGYNIFNTAIGYSVFNDDKVLLKSKVIDKKSVFDEIEVISQTTRDIDSIGQLDVSNVTNKDEMMLDDNNADLGKLVTILFKEVKELKAELKRLKEGA